MSLIFYKSTNKKIEFTVENNSKNNKKNRYLSLKIINSHRFNYFFP